MNIYKSQNFPKRMLTSEHLNDEAWNFANTLAAGRWKHQAIKRVEITRSIIEQFGDGFDLPEHYGEPISNEVVISFMGLKRYMETERGFVMSPTYAIKSTTLQPVNKDEIPEGVVEEMIEDAKEKHHPLREIIRDKGLKVSDLPLNTFEDVDIQRIQEAIYPINHRGEFEDYILRYFYTVNDVNVHEVEYTQSNNEYIWNPVKMADGSLGENKPLILAELNEDSVESAAANFDDSFDKFLIDQNLQELTSYTELPKEEHIRRVLGMISMVSGNFVDLRNHATK
jgi:hypothetical protein